MEFSEQTDLKTVIKAIKKKEIRDHYDVPEVYRNNPEIVKVERMMNLRELSKR
ncbi:hypothetical protein [Eubacterium oxidoreducens]|uniref:Uncharacterized protein n=1 Tax=Eubacterium oxidoreducens TaxID=1732 RepID=A0A1G6AYM9_EUBOX|nr:hypothetical protein [Eubacterium oxidoreducens]SDB13379.1 hypothetical protein SAMN02910417_01025 [Eubacterium oxidoreducens]